MLGVFVAGACGRPGAMYRAVPPSFVPNEDEGYFITILQAPAGASLEYTTNLAKQAENSHHGAARSAGGVFGGGIQLQRVGAEPGADVHAAEAVRGAARCRASR